MLVALVLQENNKFTWLYMDLIIIKKKSTLGFAHLTFCREKDLVVPGNRHVKSRRKLLLPYVNVQEIHYDLNEKEFCLSMRTLSRNLDCHSQTIKNVIDRAIAAGTIELSPSPLTNFHLSKSTLALYEEFFPAFLEEVSYNNKVSDIIKAKTLTFWVNYLSLKEKYEELIIGADFELDHREMSLALENRRTKYPIQVN